MAMAGQDTTRPVYKAPRRTLLALLPDSTGAMAPLWIAFGLATLFFAATGAIHQKTLLRRLSNVQTHAAPHFKPEDINPSHMVEAPKDMKSEAVIRKLRLNQVKSKSQIKRLSKLLGKGIFTSETSKILEDRLAERGKEKDPDALHFQFLHPEGLSISDEMDKSKKPVPRSKTALEKRKKRRKRRRKMRRERLNDKKRKIKRRMQKISRKKRKLRRRKQRSVRRMEGRKSNSGRGKTNKTSVTSAQQQNSVEAGQLSSLFDVQPQPATGSDDKTKQVEDARRDSKRKSSKTISKEKKRRKRRRRMRREKLNDKKSQRKMKRRKQKISRKKRKARRKKQRKMRRMEARKSAKSGGEKTKKTSVTSELAKVNEGTAEVDTLPVEDIHQTWRADFDQSTGQSHDEVIHPWISEADNSHLPLPIPLQPWVPESYDTVSVQDGETGVSALQQNSVEAGQLSSRRKRGHDKPRGGQTTIFDVLPQLATGGDKKAKQAKESRRDSKEKSSKTKRKAIHGEEMSGNSGQTESAKLSEIRKLKDKTETTSDNKKTQQTDNNSEENTNGQIGQGESTQGVIKQLNVVDSSNIDKGSVDKSNKIPTNTIKKTKLRLTVKRDVSRGTSKMIINKLKSPSKQNTDIKQTRSGKARTTDPLRNKAKPAGKPVINQLLGNTERGAAVAMETFNQPDNGPAVREGDPTGPGVPAIMCNCLVSGGSHYYMFDGQVLRFAGSCIYTLSRTVASDVPCAYNVEVTNEYRDGIETVSYTRSVRVQTQGITISLEKERKLVVNDVLLIPPLSLANDTLLVTYVGSMLEIYCVTCGIKVAFDGQMVRVQHPSGLGSDVYGLCGNCNGAPDDYKLRTGADVSEEPDRFSQIADSFMMSQGCMSIERPTTCQNEAQAKQACDSAIGEQAFTDCLALMSAAASQISASCVIEYCQWENDPPKLNDVICKTLESLAAICRDAGQVVDWRTPNLCLMTCVNSQYSVNASGCQTNCASTTDGCGPGTWEGCVCGTGQYLSGTECVNSGDCGCDRNGLYFPLGHVIVTSSCETELTCQADGTWSKKTLSKCVDNAVCDLVDGERMCMCRAGYSGDGYSSCVLMEEDQEETALSNIVKEEHLRNCKTCWVMGDPHYITFDGVMFDFMGDCKYTLAISTKPNDPCAYNIEVKNELRYGLTEVSFTKYVDIETFGLHIRLGLGNTLHINGVRRYPPVIITDTLVIFIAGSIQVHTVCGVHIEFDGVHRILIRIPEIYKDKTSGICANANDNTIDDYIMKNGSDAINSTYRDSLVCGSFIVEDDDITQAMIDAGETRESCIIMTLNPACDDSSIQLAKDHNHCGVMLDPSSAFVQCTSELGTVEVHKFFNSCVYDLCTFEYYNIMEMNDQLCRALGAFASRCSQSGLSVDWRDSSFCPIFCPEGSHYNPAMSGCQATVTDPIPQLDCPLLDREGCECDVGYLLSDTTCVRQEERGCQDSEDNYFPIGTGYISRDCSTEFLCESDVTGAYFSSNNYMTCNTDAECVPVEGKLTCQCISGFIGDGITCTEDTPQAQTPRAPSCDCMQISGRFYKTYDGQVVDFQGDCTYILTQHDNSDCVFAVTVSNFNTGQDSFYRTVNVTVYGLTVTLGPNYRVMVDGVIHYLPVVLANLKVSVTLSGRILTLVADCGLTVAIDGDALVSLQVDTLFMSQLSGICGNCDGLKNDFILPDGSDLTNDPDGSSKLANYYRREVESCQATAISNTCTATDITNAQSNDVCGLLSDTMFQNCLVALEEGGSWISDACVADLCSPPGDKCDFYEALVMTCAQNDVPVTSNWREAVQCPLVCGPNQQYSPTLSGCQGNCLFPAQLSCPLPISEGCECVPGTILSDTECVPFSECGCRRDSVGFQTYPLGTSYTSDTCDQSVTCTPFVLGAILQITPLPPCTDNANCTLLEGERQCACDVGYGGDGWTSCSQIADPEGTSTAPPAELPVLLNAEPQTPKLTTPQLFTTPQVTTTEQFTTVSEAETTKQLTTIPQTQTAKQLTTTSLSQTTELLKTAPEVKTTEQLTTTPEAKTTKQLTASPGAKTTQPFTTASGAKTTEPLATILQTQTTKQLTTTSLPETTERLTTEPQTKTTIQPTTNEQLTTMTQLQITQQLTATRLSQTTYQLTTAPQPETTEQLTTRPPQTTTLSKTTQRSATTSEPQEATTQQTVAAPLLADSPTLVNAESQSSETAALTTTQQSDTTPAPNTAPESTLMTEPYTTQPSSTTTEPKTALQSTVTEEPNQTQRPSTTSEPKTTPEPIIMPEPKTTEQSSTIPEPKTTEQNSTTPELKPTPDLTTVSQQTNTAKQTTVSHLDLPVLLNAPSANTTDDNGETQTTPAEPPCLCSIKGDPHMLSFDLARLNIFCPCKYVLSEAEVNGSDCSFRVEGRNKFRPGLYPDRAYLEYMDIIIGDVNVTIQRNLSAMVNGVPVTFPTQTSAGVLTLHDHHVYFTSNCGLVVCFDGIQRAYISAPAMYRTNMKGLCGNCDGLRANDVAEGHFVSHHERDRIFARNFLIVEESNTFPDCQLPT